MSTPVATIADALFAFIMSLLRDPDAVEQFVADPQAALTSNGLNEACAADVRAVKPVVVDHPAVTPKPAGQQQQYPPTDQHDADPDPSGEVIREITRIVNQFTSIDARTTIVDQSTNQNIWTDGGDVTQIFDQSAVVASGDEAVAAGNNATIVDSDVDITVGDVSVGNTTNVDSFNTTDTDNSTIDGSFNITDTDNSTIDSSFNTTGPDGDADPAAAAIAVTSDAITSAVEQPVDLLSTDLTQSDVTYESDAAASAVVEDAPIEETAEEQ